MAPSALTIGSPLPEFENLADVAGQKVSSTELGDPKALVVVFSCHDCPYVQAYEDRMNAFQKAYADRGVRLVAVNSNDASQYPEDSYQEMVGWARQKRIAFLYVQDHDQSVARLFGATHTPEFFLFARGSGESVPRLRCHGGMDDNHREPGAVTRRSLVEAVEAVLAGTPVPQEETHSIDCTIKWKYPAIPTSGVAGPAPS